MTQIISGNFEEKLAVFQTLIEYYYTEISWLVSALLHKSVPISRFLDVKTRDNEHMAFVGDRVLGLIVAEHQLRTHLTAGDVQLGDLNAGFMKSVNNSACEQYARNCHLDKILIYGDCAVRVFPKPLTLKITSNMLADSFEALLSSVYLDGGLECARAVFYRCQKDLTPALMQIPSVCLPLRCSAVVGAQSFPFDSKRIDGCGRGAES